MSTTNKQQYPLYPYPIEPITLSKEDLKKMVKRIKAQKFNRIMADDYEWNFKFEKNYFLFYHIKLKAMLVSAPLEKDGDNFIIKYVWAYPKVDDYFKFEFMLKATPFEEKLAKFLEIAFQLFLRKKWLVHNLDNPKRYKRREYKTNLKYLLEDFNKIKQMALAEEHYVGRWTFRFRYNWLNFFLREPWGGYYIKAKFIREKNHMIINKMFVYPGLKEGLRHLVLVGGQRRENWAFR